VVEKSSGRLRVGVVVRDDQGRVLAARSLTHMGPKTGEALASYYVACLCKEIGVQYLLLESDTKQILYIELFGHLVDDTQNFTNILTMTTWHCSLRSKQCGSPTGVTFHPNDTQYCPLLTPLNQTSQEVTHPGTTLAEARLTTEF
jgi:hypothetical protein